MKNAYNPDKEDLIEWVNSKDKSWPLADWDHYVIDGNNDTLVLQFANDTECIQRPFFEHVLYLIVGLYFHEGQKNPEHKKRIDYLLSLVNDDGLSDIVEWKRKVENLLSGAMEYDSEFWLNYMFYEDMKKYNDVDNDDWGV